MAMLTKQYYPELPRQHDPVRVQLVDASAIGSPIRAQRAKN